MIGRNGSYFDPDLALQGHYIITGNTNDNFCSDLLQITDIRKELHRHLLSQGFDAVFYFDYTNMLYCYDYDSFRILTGALSEGTEEDPEEEDASIAMTGPFGANLAGFNAAFEQPEQPAQVPPAEIPMRLNLGAMRMESAWQQVIALLRDNEYRCALVLSNINSMQSTFSVPALQALQELTAGSSTMSSVVIYIFRGNTMVEMLTQQTHYGTGEWNIFFQSVLRPLMETDDPDENRVISLRTPNAAEVRNLLNYIRFQNAVALQVEPRQLQDLASALSYGCARENWSLKQLRSRIENYAQNHPGTVMNMDNYSQVTGLPRHTTAMQDLERLVGLEGVKKDMRKLFGSMRARAVQSSFPEQSTRFSPLPRLNHVRGHLLNVCLMGNAGTGKTEIARLMGRMYYEANVLPQGHVVPVSAGTMVSQNVGGTAMNVRALVQQAMGGVLFIDEAYALIKNEHGREAIDQLVNDMTTYEGQFAVIIAGYPRQMKRLLQSNEGLASRFGTTFHLPDYNADEMRQILDIFISNDPDRLVLAPELRAQLEVFCDNWATDHDQNWGNAREAGRLVSQMKRNALDRISRSHTPAAARDPVELLPEDLPEHLRKHLKPKAQRLEDVLKQIEEMTGLNNVKVFLKKLADGALWDDQQPAPGRFIFHGPPGTGKTHVARLMGIMLRRLGVLERDFVYEVAAQDLLRPDPAIDYGGNNDPTPQEILQAAVDNARGGIFFIDEAHQLSQTPEGRMLIRALVPIVENPDYRRNTCFILAGYSTEMRELLRQDAGLSRRFPEACRIRFDNYTADELTRILKGMAEDRNQILEQEYLDRTCIALSRYLENPPENYGNAGFIRDTYLPESIRTRFARLNQTYAGSATALVSTEVAQNVPAEEKRTLTGRDLPPKFQVMAGPLGLPVPKPKTAWDRIEELVGKAEVKEYLLTRRTTGEQTMFYDNHAQTGLHFAVVGPTGSGRHTVVRTMTALWKHLGLLDRDGVRFVSKGDLEAGYVGQTALKSASVVEECLGGCLCVEYPSAMLRKSGSDNSYGPEALGVISGAMADPVNQLSVALIDTEEGMEELFRQMPGLKSRIAKVFRLEDLTPEEMLELFRIKTENALSFDEELRDLIPEFFLNWVSQRGGLTEAVRSWGNGTEVDHLVEELIARWKSMGGKTDPESEIPRRLITRQMFPEELQRFLKHSRADKNTAMKELMDLTGLDQVKSMVQARERETRMLKGRKPVPGCYTFIGYPGSGKTKVARLMGGVLRASNTLSQGHLIERTAQQLIQSPGNFAESLKLAKNGILFIDEAHQLRQWDSGHRVILELLTALEDARITSCTCIILAGYPEEMAALLEADQGLASRFGTDDAIIRFPNYNAEELLQILRGMARDAHTIPQILAHAPLVMEPEFEELSAELFDHVCRSGDRSFGNARYVRNYLRNCYKNLLARMDRTYPGGDYPEAEMRTLTEQDIPEDYLEFLERSEKPALVQTDQLCTVERGQITSDTYGDQVDYYLRRTVLLDVTKKDGSGSGSGTIITSGGHVLTAAHVVAGAKRIRAKLYCPGALGGDYLWFDCELLKPIQETCDMALLKMKGDHFPVMPMRTPESSVQDTEATLLIGYPLGGMLNDNRLDALKPSHFAGRVASSQIKRRMHRDVLHYYLDSRGLHGNSGSPVISQTDGRMIGVFSGSIAPKKEGNLDELNLFFPIHYFWSNFVIDTPSEEE